MNKQEKNIVDIITFDETEDIVDIFINKVYHTDKTVALITDKELVEYAMDKLLNDDCIIVKRVDLELDGEDTEYMISVDDDGYMVVQPIEYYDDKYFKDIEYAFVDMDGCVDQMTIDNLLDRDVEIVLFGYEDDMSDEFDSDFSDGICIDCCDCVDEDCPRKCVVGCKDDEKTDKAKKDEHVEYSKDKDGDLHGFTASKSDGNSYYSYSVYTSDKLSVRDIQSLLQEAGF